jgi:glutamate-1-semialdehyde aminotransferase
MGWQNRADLCIAQGALTNSKRPSTYIEGVYPTHASAGRGAHLYVGAKPYLDYVCGLGTNLIGYGHPLIAEAIGARYLKGATLSLSSELEVEVAEKLKAVVPWTELWKFTKTGTEACQAAIKIARAHTGRELVLSEGYHGWSDDFVSLTAPGVGVPKRNWMADFDIFKIKDAAAVIVEPVITDASPVRVQWLRNLRELCTQSGTLLIFDEIITGFRFPNFSVSRFFGIEPDMILLGKAMGAGLPLSAIGGSRKVMGNPDYFVSGTFFGETVSLAACSTLIDLMKRDGSKFNLSDLWSSGQTFLDQFNALSPDLKIVGYPTRGAFVGDDMVKALFWQESIKAGILFGPSWFFNFPLVSQTDAVMPIFRDIFMRIKLGNVALQGNMPKKPFAQTVRGN